MKKKALSLLMVFIMSFSVSSTCFAENVQDQGIEKEVTEMPVAEEGHLSTATQKEALEKEATENADEETGDEAEETDPIRMEEISISNADEFLAFAENCKLDTWSANKKVLITADISLLGKKFNGIPTFGGILDGQGHTIEGINISDGMSHLGFFEEIQKNAEVHNLTVSASILPSGSQINVGGLSGDNYGLIRDCTFKGVVSANDYVGGIAGYNHLAGTIENCTVQGYIKGVHFAGGIAGQNDGNISRCTNESMVNTTNTDTQITIDAMTSLTKVINFIKNIHNTQEDANADITASDVGGIAGLSIGIIARCINKGDVGYEHVGYNVGGIVGRQSGYVLNCTNNGKILGRKDVGGIAGQAEPYITVDLSSDIAYQLSESIAKLHDLVNVTLQDAKGQSNTISARLSAIQQFTAGAIDDVKFIAEGTVDFANGVASSTNEAFSRVEYVMEESSRNDGMIDHLTGAAENAGESAESLRDALKDLDILSYLSGDEKEQYESARATLESAAQQRAELYDRAYMAYYNYRILGMDGLNPKDLEMQDNDGNKSSYSDPGSIDALTEDLVNDNDTYGLRQKGNWVHTTDSAAFPVSDEEDERHSSDLKLYEKAIAQAEEDANTFAIHNYQGNDGNSYFEDIAAATQVISAITLAHLDEMTDDARNDAISSMNSIGAAADDLADAGKAAKSITGNLSRRDDIQFPQLSAEYKAHTSSLAGNLAGMNDNFGLLNSEVNNATGVLVDDLAAISEQFNTIMMLYTDAIDGVLEMDYTARFEDVTLDEAYVCTDATIDGCSNFGRIEGDIDTAGIAGTMAIEYEYDQESAITGIKDARMNSSFITKCAVRACQNYGEAVGEKNFVGGICGLQELGTIVRDFNYANIRSSSGERVGGIAGTSYSYIIDSASKGILSAPTYVGGIVGDGNKIRNCFSIVKIEDATGWYGAIAGHIDENGEASDNFFVSDELAGIDRISYAGKAEPVSYNQAISSGQKGDFKKLTVTFRLKDDDLEGGEEVIAKIKKDYGDSIDISEYPGLKNKPGFYASWDITSFDRITTDLTVTATYKRYRTTLAEENASDELIQSELLVDGMFKEDDRLVVEKTINFTGEDPDLTNYETIKVTVPNDGQSSHQMRFRPINSFGSVYDAFGKHLGGKISLYRIENGDRILLEPTGTMGKYNTYEIEGNDFTLSLDVAEVRDTAEKILVIIIVFLVLFLVLIIVAIVMIKKSGKHVPRLFRHFVKDVTRKIETKEQIFYDESKESEVNTVDSDVETTDDNTSPEQSEKSSELTENVESDSQNKSEDK